MFLKIIINLINYYLNYDSLLILKATVKSTFEGWNGPIAHVQWSKNLYSTNRPSLTVETHKEPIYRHTWYIPSPIYTQVSRPLSPGLSLGFPSSQTSTTAPFENGERSPGRARQVPDFLSLNFPFNSSFMDFFKHLKSLCSPVCISCFTDSIYEEPFSDTRGNRERLSFYPEI